MKLKRQTFDRKALVRITTIIGLGSALVIPTIIFGNRFNKNLDNPMTNYYQIVDSYTLPASKKYTNERLNINPKVLEIRKLDLFIMTEKEAETKEIKDAFEIAQYQDNYPVLGRFIDKFKVRGLDINKINDEKGRTMLMVAAFYGRAGNVNTLLKKGADVFATDQNGNDARYYAIAGRNLAIAKTLSEQKLYLNPRTEENMGEAIIIAKK
ncbi:MAG: ankyrin repeat domain-containing protein [Candidatus Micrarchaeota archaeon]